MSKSTRMTPEQLRLMGLEPDGKGGYRKKKIDVKEVYDEISKKEPPSGVYSPDDFNDQVLGEKKKTRKVKSRTYVTGKLMESSADKVVFTVIGEPPHQERHRHRIVGEGDDMFVSTYDPSAGEKKKFLEAISGFAPAIPFDGPLRMCIYVYCSRPKNHYGTGKNSGILKSSAPTYKTTKPDVDNHEKFIKDAMNKVFFVDDSNICMTDVRKSYTPGDYPYTFIALYKIT